MKQNGKKAKNQIFMYFVHDNGCRPHKRQDPFGPLSRLPGGPLDALLVVLCTLWAAYPRALQAPAWAAQGPQEEKREKTQKETFFSTSSGRSS